MFKDDPSCQGHVSFWSEGAPISSSSSPDGSSPLIRGHMPPSKTHYPNGFRFSMDPEMPDSPVREKVGGTLTDQFGFGFGLSDKFRRMIIRDEEEDAVKFNGQLPLEQSDDKPYGSWFNGSHSVGSDYGDVVTCRNCFSNAYGGYQDLGIQNSAILDEERRLLTFGSQQYHMGNLRELPVSSHRLTAPFLYEVNSTNLRNVQSKQVMEDPSDEVSRNLQLSSEASLGRNCYYGGIQVPDNANAINRASVANVCFCSHQNRSNSNGDWVEKMSPSLPHSTVPNLPSGIGNEPLHSLPMFSDRVIATPNGWAPQSPPSTRGASSIDAFTCEDSLIIQGKDLHFARNDGYDLLRKHKRSSYNALGRGNSSENDLELAENWRGPRMYCPSLVPSKYSSLQEVKGYISFIAKDHQGCLFLQRKFDEGTPEDVQMMFNEIIGHVVELMVNSFGNYVVQKLLDVCTEEQRMLVVLVVTADPRLLVKISLNTHGTRVVQKLIETLKTREQISLVVSALEPGFLDLIRDLNGNHVVQRCLQCLSNEDNMFIFNSAAKYCVDIATNRHGCCVLQRCIAQSTGEDLENLVAEISSNGLFLAQDAFGNYVVQYILELKIPLAIRNLVSQFEGNYVHLSTQKFSSNVVEKCLRVFGEEIRSRIIHELIATSRFEQLLQDPYANYVIQSALVVSKDYLHASLAEAIRPFAAVLRTNPYCRRIFSRMLLKR